jgi:uncharacterized protein (TIGR03435 family)
VRRVNANRCWSVLAGLAWLGANAALAQSPKLEFEVASVKPSGPVTSVGAIRVTGGPGSRYPERFTFNGANLRALLVQAYGLVDSQQQISGPSWIDTERYAVDTKMPPGTTREQFQQMLQSLLADRFKLAVHHETKVLSVYELVVGKSGHKLRESAKTPNADASDRVVMDGGRGPSGQATQNWTFGQQTMSKLAVQLSSLTGRRVVDKTGLTEKYDFTLSYDLPQPDAPILDIFDAVQQQLGLRLVDAKDPFDLVVVDHAEKVPTGN